MQMIFSRMPGWRSIVYLIVLVACFLLFQQSDLLHTFTSSYAYLGGHFSDFYDFNKVAVNGNDYLPLLYVIYAIWNLPLLFLGLIPPAEQFATADLTIQLIWAKLLIVIFFFASAWVLSGIAGLLKNDPKINQQRYPEAIFITAPIAIFAVFDFGQYDIIGVFFTLLGFYFYLKNDFLRFAIFFSIAISFKYFSLVIYIPLVLLIEKNPLKILRLILIGVAAVLIQLAIYWHSEIFGSEIFRLITLKAVGESQDRISWSKPTVYMVALYSLGCFYIYFKRFNNDFEWRRAAVFVPVGAFGLMLSAVTWHPQWLIIATPFFALSYLYINNAKLFVFIDVLAMLAFIVLCVNKWPNNVDVSMMQLGVLRAYIPTDLLLGNEFLPRELMGPARFILYTYFFCPLLLLARQSWKKQAIIQGGMTANILFTRFFVGSGIFLLLAIACLYKTVAYS